jgi:hypothetical protein
MSSTLASTVGSKPFLPQLPTDFSPSSPCLAQNRKRGKVSLARAGGTTRRITLTRPAKAKCLINDFKSEVVRVGPESVALPNSILDGMPGMAPQSHASSNETWRSFGPLWRSAVFSFVKHHHQDLVDPLSEAGQKGVVLTNGCCSEMHLGSQVFVTESCLPVNRPHENPEKRP